jgi:hypothetical protein
MRLAFLPVVVVLAGGVAWSQTAASEMSFTARESPAPLVLKAQNALTLALVAAQRPEVSGLQPIPTQWPHAKLEPIPTQWKAKVILVGGGPARPAGMPAGALVVPK